MKNSIHVLKNSSLSPIFDMQRNLDRLFGDIFEGVGPDPGSRFTPVCDVEETESSYLITLEVPGVRKEDIKIEVQDGQLTISGKKERETKKEESSVRIRERTYGEFRRVFSLPTQVDVEKIEASYEHGELILALPKAQTARTKQIQIGSDKGSVLNKVRTSSVA